MIGEKSAKVPPDGGWGWIIVMAFAINGLSTIPIMQGFGLIFKDTFPLLGFNATDVSIIINTNLAFSMALGLLNGPLLRKYGSRKVAVSGSLIYTSGVALTAFSNSFPMIILSYGVLASLGMGVTMSAFSYSLNCYFTKKRGRAMGLAQTIIGLGPILMPHVASWLLPVYGFQGTILLFASFTLHSIVGALLLHPLEWHMKDAVASPECAEDEPLREQCTQENSGIKDVEGEANAMLDGKRFQRKRKITTSSIDHDVEVGSIYGFETTLHRQFSEPAKTSMFNKNMENNKPAETADESKPCLKNRKLSTAWWNSARSVNTIHLGSSIKIFEEQFPDSLSRYYSVDDVTNKPQNAQPVPEIFSAKESLPAATPMDAHLADENRNAKCQKKSIAKRVFMRVVDFYDLRLLKDPIYVNIMLGMSIAIFAEINFSLLTPFILTDMGLTTKKIASAMSLMAGVDLVFRSIAPYLGEWIRQPPRVMYLISLALLVASRTSLIFARSFGSVLYVAAGLGAAKGIRSVYMTLVVPSYVPIHRLPHASGIQMMMNGLFLMIAGPILGLVRDRAGSYIPCIIIMNCVTVLTITMWSIEIFIVRGMNLRCPIGGRKERHEVQQ